MSLRVVKVGTSLLRSTEGRSTADAISALCLNLAQCLHRGDRVVLFTSGAAGLGC